MHKLSCLCPCVLQNARGGQGQGLIPAHTHNIQETSQLAALAQSSLVLQQQQQDQHPYQPPTTYRPLLVQRRDSPAPGTSSNVQIVPALDYRVPLLAADGIVARLHQLRANVQDDGELIGYTGFQQPVAAQRRLDRGGIGANQPVQAHARFQQYQGRQKLESYRVQY